MHPTHMPIRLTTGAYILNSGISKLKSSDEEAEQMHGWASSTYPVLGDMKPTDFTKALAYAEIGLGGALLLPKVPSAIAGSALAAFGAGLLGLYFNTPGMTQKDGIRPTAEGNGLAKDVWLVGAGLTLAQQSFLSGVKNAAKNVSDGVTGAADNVKSGITGAVSSKQSKAQKGLSGWVNKASDARADLSDALSDLADSLAAKK